jgi:hypothetical protein
METLGISSNTWLKIKRGEAIRRSIGERLLSRFDDRAPHRSTSQAEIWEQGS